MTTFLTQRRRNVDCSATVVCRRKDNVAALPNEIKILITYKNRHCNLEKPIKEVN